MAHFILERWRELPLEFDGEVIVDLSSKEPDSNRWQEIRIYHTDTDRFVTEVVGRSSVPGEHDIITVKMWRHAKFVRRGVVRKQDGHEWYTDLALEALELANEEFPGIYDDTLTERI